MTFHAFVNFILAVHCNERVVSVPDLHGDFERTVNILTAAGLIDPETLSWTGGNATLVQTGDIVDRGDHAKQIYELFFRLAEEATRVGGYVVNLMGNHELLNIENDLRYVTPADFQAFGGEASRAKAWGPEGWLGRRVRHFPAVAKAGGVLFVHAGLLPRFLSKDNGLDNVNRDLQAALLAKDLLVGADASILSDDGPAWTRFFAYRTSPELCGTVQDLLRRIGATRMVVGHTIQRTSSGFRVRQNCGGRVLLADTGVSRAYGGEASYIEHDGDGGAVAVYPGIGLRQPLRHPKDMQIDEVDDEAPVLLLQ